MGLEVERTKKESYREIKREGRKRQEGRETWKWREKRQGKQKRGKSSYKRENRTERQRMERDTNPLKMPPKRARREK